MSPDDSIAEESKVVAGRIYKAYLPPYLKKPWERGRGKGYEDWLKEQLQMLVMSEVLNSPDRLTELKYIEETVALVFGIFGAAFRILDHMGMHLRGQTFGQYELLKED